MMERFVWIGPVFHVGGFGEVARNFVRGLDAIGADVGVVNSSDRHGHMGAAALAEIDRIASRPVRTAGATAVYNMAPTELERVLAAAPMLEAERRIACTVTETDRIPDEWVTTLRAFDEVWVPASFHREVFVRCGVPSERVRVVPYGVDTDHFRPAPEVASRARERFRFLYTFQFDWRKGFDLLLEAYLSEFRRDEAVELVLKVFDLRDGADIRGELIRSICNRVDLFDPELPRVTVLTEPVDASRLVELLRSADLYVSTDRANGWGMPCQEAMSCGRPAACIDWSGSTEFMHEDNALLIPHGPLVQVDPRLVAARPFYAGQRWPAVRVDDVRAVLRAALEQPAQLARIAEAGCASVREGRGLAAAARGIVDRDRMPYTPRPGLVEKVRAGLGPESDVPAARAPGGSAGREPLGWMGPAVGRSGYAAGGRGLIHAAVRAGRPVRLIPTDRPEPDIDVPALPPLAPEQAKPRVWVLHSPPTYAGGFPAWEAMARHVSGWRIGATCFESDRIPDTWVEACRSVVDEVWVPTRFNLRTFAAAGVDPGRLHAVPYPVDTDVFTPGTAARTDDRVTFLSTFEWTWRKGWDVLLRAYLEEFALSEPVRLRILTYRGAGAMAEGTVLEQVTDAIRGMGHDPEEIPEVELILDPVDHADLPGLYRSADAFVLASRGEGMGMPVLEAMACGRPVVATAYGGYEELMDPELAFPVDVSAMTEAPAALLADNPLYRGQRLAEPSVTSLRSQMRAIVEHPDEAARRGRRAMAVVRERFSIPAASRVLERRLEEIDRAGSHRRAEAA